VAPIFDDTFARLCSTLSGTWLIDSKDQTYNFQPMDDKRYLATIVGEKHDTIQYVVIAGQLGGQWFLDSYPKDSYDDHHVLLTHIIHRITIVGDTLEMASLESDWLKKMIDAKKISIGHARNDGEIILTASTAELQKFFRRFAKDRDAFPKPGKLVRSK
jgi:hypothetical protein